MKHIAKFWSLPTWLIVLVAWSHLPAHHDWHGKPRFTLLDWHLGCTALSHTMNGIIWLTAIAVAEAVWGATVATIHTVLFIVVKALLLLAIAYFSVRSV